MNFFETELKRMTENSKTLQNRKFAADACIARLDKNKVVKAAFKQESGKVTFDGIKIKVISTAAGELDTLTIDFTRIWGEAESLTKTCACWEYNDGKWHNFKPTETDYKKVLTIIDDYLENFKES